MRGAFSVSLVTRLNTISLMLLYPSYVFHFNIHIHYGMPLRFSSLGSAIVMLNDVGGTVLGGLHGFVCTIVA